eukprot:883329-Prorocentrum_minimum.AAC.1
MTDLQGVSHLHGALLVTHAPLAGDVLVQAALHVGPPASDHKPPRAAPSQAGGGAPPPQPGRRGGAAPRAPLAEPQRPRLGLLLDGDGGQGGLRLRLDLRLGLLLHVEVDLLVVQRGGAPRRRVPEATRPRLVHDFVPLVLRPLVVAPGRLRDGRGSPPPALAPASRP